MLEFYDKYDAILMPLNPVDPSYLSFERQVLPKAAARGMGIQAMKSRSRQRHTLDFRPVCDPPTVTDLLQ